MLELLTLLAAWGACQLPTFTATEPGRSAQIPRPIRAIRTGYLNIAHCAHGGPTRRRRARGVAAGEGSVSQGSAIGSISTILWALGCTRGLSSI